MVEKQEEKKLMKQKEQKNNRKNKVLYHDFPRIYGQKQQNETKTTKKSSNLYIVKKK